MKIGEFALKTGLSKDTIRYYEKFGLLQPEKENNQRVYDEHDLELVSVIIKLKFVGFSLEEIKKLIEFGEGIDREQTLNSEEIREIEEIKKLFQQKQMEIKKQEQWIKDVKKILSNAEMKLEWLLERNAETKGIK